MGRTGADLVQAELAIVGALVEQAGAMCFLNRRTMMVA
jgi:hypothetical protein